MANVLLRPEHIDFWSQVIFQIDIFNHYWYLQLFWGLNQLLENKFVLLGLGKLDRLYWGFFCCFNYRGTLYKYSSYLIDNNCKINLSAVKCVIVKFNYMILTCRIFRLGWNLLHLHFFPIPNLIDIVAEPRSMMATSITPRSTFAKSALCGICRHSNWIDTLDSCWNSRLHFFAEISFDNMVIITCKIADFLRTWRINCVKEWMLINGR